MTLKTYLSTEDNKWHAACTALVLIVLYVLAKIARTKP